MDLSILRLPAERAAVPVQSLGGSFNKLSDVVFFCDRFCNLSLNSGEIGSSLSTRLVFGRSLTTGLIGI